MAEHKILKAEELEVGMEVAYPTYIWAGWHRYYRHRHWKGYTVKRITPKRTKVILLGADGEEKKPDKTVAVAVDADTPAEDVAKQISDVVAKTVAEMMGKKKEE